MQREVPTVGTAFPAHAGSIHAHLASRGPRLHSAVHPRSAEMRTPLVAASVGGHFRLHGVLGLQVRPARLCSGARGAFVGSAGKPAPVSPFFTKLTRLMPTVQEGLRGGASMAAGRVGGTRRGSVRVAFRLRDIWKPGGCAALRCAALGSKRC